MGINVDEIYKITFKHYEQAKSNIITKGVFEHSADAISDVIPGFEADKLEFGSYDKENYAVLFADMRRSTGWCGKDIPHYAHISNGSIRSCKRLSWKSYRYYGGWAYGLLGWIRCP